MFKSEYSSESARQEGCDPRLRAVLQAWPTPEPRGGFETAVWRRIRAAAARPEPQHLSARARFRALIHTPLARASALAAAAGIAVGVGLAVAGSGAHADRRTHGALLHPQTLSGSYLALARGGAR